MAKILLVEDDFDLAFALADRLKREHYTVEVADEGEQALHLLKCGEYDAVILDWNLPNMSGLAILKELRGRGVRTPVLLLTARSDVHDKAQGLDNGADDYLTKPFDPIELSARVRAMLRRASNQPTNLITTGPYTIDPQHFTVFKHGKEIHLQPKEFALLELFMRHPGEVFSQEALLHRIWVSESETSPESVRVYIKNLRQKIDGDDEQSCIQTVFKRGYCFVPDP
jgi:two-component system, OmpR family, copper resistance phosphate regulon response regulator CusR